MNDHNLSLVIEEKIAPEKPGQFRTYIIVYMPRSEPSRPWFCSPRSSYLAIVVATRPRAVLLRTRLPENALRPSYTLPQLSGTTAMPVALWRLAASVATVAAAAAAAARVPTCPDGTSAVGATADGEWIVCEATLSADPLTGASVPSGELRFLHATNGSVHSFSKTSEAMYGCGGQHANATDGCFLGMDPGPMHQCPSCMGELFSRIGNQTDPTYEAVKAIWPAMVWDGGWDFADPVHGGSWTGRPDQRQQCGYLNGHPDPDVRLKGF